jgi:hypothetical protein
MAHNPFDEIFRRMMRRFFKDLEEMEKEFGQRESLIKKPREFMVKTPSGYVRGGGFSIFISSDGKRPPKIEVRHFGPSGKWEKVPLEEEKVASELKVGRKPLKVPVGEPEKIERRIVKERVIPEYDVSVDVSGVTITLNADGVESEENVRLRFYPGSVEVYALAPETCREYFCTVALPDSIDKERGTIKVEEKKVVIRIPRKPQFV